MALAPSSSHGKVFMSFLYCNAKDNRAAALDQLTCEIPLLLCLCLLCLVLLCFASPAALLLFCVLRCRSPNWVKPHFNCVCKRDRQYSSFVWILCYLSMFVCQFVIFLICDFVELWLSRLSVFYYYCHGGKSWGGLGCREWVQLIIFILKPKTQVKPWKQKTPPKREERAQTMIRQREQKIQEGKNQTKTSLSEEIRT